MTPHRQPSSRQGRRARLLAAAAALALVVAVLVAGQPWPAPELRTATPAVPPPSASAGLPSSRRDAVAAAPMLAVQPGDARPTTGAGQPAPLIAVPAPTRVGPAGVPSGFPRTPEGAVGQLAAIETTVFTAMSLPQTVAVHRAWALPGGAHAGEWTLTRHVRAFLSSAQMGSELDGTATVTAVPAGGLVKGSDGPDWVLACALLEVRATIRVEARIGYGHCERMQWQPDPHPNPKRPGSTRLGEPGGRWVVGPGTAPAVAPSTWPGSEASRVAGWRTWTGTAPAGAGR